MSNRDRAGPEPAAGRFAEEAALLAAAVRDWMSADTRVGGVGGSGAGSSSESMPPCGHGATTNTSGLGSDGRAADRLGSDGRAAGGLGADRWAGADDGGTGRSTRDDGDAPPGPGQPQPAASACQVCPVCRLIAVVSASHPEAILHLAAALASLNEVYRVIREAWVAAAPPTPSTTEPGVPSSSSASSPFSSASARPRSSSTSTRPRVQRIDVR